jgi:hypothetical protein
MINKLGGRPAVYSPVSIESPSTPAITTAPATKPQPAGTTPVSTNAPASNQAPAHRSYQSPNVMVMQKQLLEIYNEFKSNSAQVPDFFKAEKENPKPGDKGPSSFMYFLMHRYINKAKDQADQYDLTAPDAKSYSTNALPKSDFPKYLEMLRIFGAHTTTDKAKAPDGQWGTYTTNAVKAAWSIAYSMVAIARQLGEKINFSDSDLSELAKNIPNAQTTSLEVNAKNIIPLLGKLNKSVATFITILVGAESKYSQYINGDKQFDVLKGGKTRSWLSQKEQVNIANKRSIELPGILIPQDLGNKNPSENDNTITIGDLASINNLKSYLTKNKIFIGDADKVDWNDPKNLAQAITYIKNQVVNKQEPNAKI